MPDTSPAARSQGASPWGGPKRAAQVLLDILFPPRCAGCGQLGSVFCRSCQARVIPVRTPVCVRCGHPLAAPAEATLCDFCRRTRSPIDGITSTAVYAPPLREAIHHFKYRNGRALAAPLAQRMVTCWQDTGLRADLIVPVPLHTARQVERGYNQAVLLVGVFGAAAGIDIDERLLVRQRATLPQVDLGRAERKRNVSGAFAATRQVHGVKLLLVDDVCTTGATLEACAQALRDAGAAGVWALTVARAHWGPEVSAPDASGLARI